MSYGDAQITAIERSRTRVQARGSASLRGLGEAGLRTFRRNPVASTAAIVVGGLATATVARSSGRATRFVKRLTVSGLSLLKLEGVLALARSLTSGSSPLVAPLSTDDAPAAARSSPANHR